MISNTHVAAVINNDNRNGTRMLNACRKAFWYKNVNMLLGFTLDINGNVAPLIIDSSNDIHKLVWNNKCKQNLAKYILKSYSILNKTRKKIAVVAKPCDTKVIKEYLYQNIISRKQIHIIGMECHGMVSNDGKICEKCIDCEDSIPQLYDTLVRCEAENQSNELKLNCDLGKNVKLADTLLALNSEIKNCTLCFSCRHICPCFDYDECFVYKKNSEGMDDEARMGVKLTYHFGKALHLSQKCISCGMCEKVCPSGIKVKQVSRDILSIINSV